MIGKEKRKYLITTHAERLRPFYGSDLDVTPEMIEDAHYSVGELEVEALEDFGVDDDGELVVKVRWVGFEEEEWRSWEPAKNLNEDVPNMMKKFALGQLKDENMRKFAEKAGYI